MNSIKLELINNLKESISAFKGMLKSLDEATNVHSVLGLSMPIDEIVDVSLKSFALYLCASDGIIAQDEADFLNQVFGSNLTTDELKQLIVDCGIYTHEFEETAPLPLTMACYAEAAINNHLGYADVPYSDQVIKLYSIFGESIIQCDYDVSSMELADLNLYISMLRIKSNEIKLQLF